MSRKVLENVFDEIITVDVKNSEDQLHLSMLGRPELGVTFTKLHCWNLTQYNKCVFLDADTLVSLIGIFHFRGFSLPCVSLVHENIGHEKLEDFQESSPQ